MSTRRSVLYVETPFKSRSGEAWALHAYHDYPGTKTNGGTGLWIEFGPDGYNWRLRLWPLPPTVRKGTWEA
jgi:hypothetical protein